MSPPARRGSTSAKITPTEHRIHVGDTCALRSDTNRVGVVGRTFYDVDTHVHDSLQRLLNIEHNPAVSPQDFTSFVNTGIPPRGHVVLTWLDRTGVAEDPETSLTPESELCVIDRELLIGDVVKLEPRDSMCGVVVAEHVNVDLIPPRRWPQPSSASTSRPQPFPQALIQRVPAAEICHSLDFAPGKLVLHRNWIGKIIDYFENVKLRLSDGSVVQLEDPTDIEGPNIDDNTGPDVGDYISTKKGNLRRGQWIYGAYQPNLAPAGYVAELEVREIEVEWLSQKYIMAGSEPMSSVPPPAFVDLGSLSPGEIRMYERPTLSTPGDSGSIMRGGRALDIGTGDRVRFRDLQSSESKYGSGLCRIPRTDTLGFDTNIYTVASTSTEVTVQWQDLTTDRYKSIELIPALDMDIEEDVFPGELVITKKADKSSDIITLKPEKVGIVQSIDSRNRIATVRWFGGSVSFAGDDTALMLPGSWTGPLQSSVEETSLYDIWTGMSRKVGDIVGLGPATVDSIDPKSSQYAELYAALNAPGETVDWVGEVVELSVEGHLTVRLGISSMPRDIRVPWECTLLVEAGYDHGDSEDSYGSDFSGDGHMDLDGSFDGIWLDENNDPVEASGQEAEWMTSDEESGNEETVDVPMSDAPGENIHNAENDTTLDLPTPDPFSYEKIFKQAASTPDTHSSLEPFTVLSGTPSEHHFAGRAAGDLDGQRLRRIQKEHKILRSSLPAGIYVRTWESGLDLLRVLILGPLGTPYEYAPFMIDLYLDSSFPAKPPQTFFHSWTDSTGPVNPNLYEDGKICLSLLGTWPGDNPGDSWSPKSTILQVLVSIVGLVLVKEPYYNEAGFEVRAGAAETLVPSAQYTERTYLRSRNFILRALTSRVEGFDETIKDLYRPSDAATSPTLLVRAIWSSIRVVRRSQRAGKQDSDTSQSEPGLRRMTLGALVPLKRYIEAMIDHVDGVGPELKKMLANPEYLASGGPGEIFDELVREDNDEDRKQISSMM